MDQFPKIELVVQGTGVLHAALQSDVRHGEEPGRLCPPPPVLISRMVWQVSSWFHCLFFCSCYVYIVYTPICSDFQKAKKPWIHWRAPSRHLDLKVQLTGESVSALAQTCLRALRAPADRGHDKSETLRKGQQAKTSFTSAWWVTKNGPLWLASGCHLSQCLSVPWSYLGFKNQPPPNSWCLAPGQSAAIHSVYPPMQLGSLPSPPGLSRLREDFTLFISTRWG